MWGRDPIVSQGASYINRPTRGSRSHRISGCTAGTPAPQKQGAVVGACVTRKDRKAVLSSQHRELPEWLWGWRFRHWCCSSQEFSEGKPAPVTRPADFRSGHAGAQEHRGAREHCGALPSRRSSFRPAWRAADCRVGRCSECWPAAVTGGVGVPGVLCLRFLEVSGPPGARRGVWESRAPREVPQPRGAWVVMSRLPPAVFRHGPCGRRCSGLVSLLPRALRSCC